jgi:hypothetical protein
MVGKKYWYVMYYMYYITYQYFFKFEYNVFAWDCWTRAPPDKMWTLYHWAMKDIHEKRFSLIPEGVRGREVWMDWSQHHNRQLAKRYLFKALNMKISPLMYWKIHDFFKTYGV